MSSEYSESILSCVFDGNKNVPLVYGKRCFEVKGMSISMYSQWVKLRHFIIHLRVVVTEVVLVLFRLTKLQNYSVLTQISWGFIGFPEGNCVIAEDNARCECCRIGNLLVPEMYLLLGKCCEWSFVSYGVKNADLEGVLAGNSVGQC